VTPSAAGQQVGIRRVGVLHPLVGVVDLGPAAPPQGRQGEPLVEAAPQFPAPNPAGEHVHEDRQVDELLLEADVCDVGDPDLVGAGHLQALDQVGVAGEVVRLSVVRLRRTGALP
jgi:hypothetical protein